MLILRTYKVKDYKRTHINDALRHFNRKLGKDDEAFYLYDNRTILPIINAKVVCGIIFYLSSSLSLSKQIHIRHQHPRYQSYNLSTVSPSTIQLVKRIKTV